MPAKKRAAFERNSAREYVVKGFVLDHKRLKSPDQSFDYFEMCLAAKLAIQARKTRLGTGGLAQNQFS